MKAERLGCHLWNMSPIAGVPWKDLPQEEKDMWTKYAREVVEFLSNEGVQLAGTSLGEIEFPE